MPVGPARLRGRGQGPGGGRQITWQLLSADSGSTRRVSPMELNQSDPISSIPWMKPKRRGFSAKKQSKSARRGRRGGVQPPTQRGHADRKPVQHKATAPARGRLAYRAGTLAILAAGIGACATQLRQIPTYVRIAAPAVALVAALAAHWAEHRSVDGSNR